MRDAEAIVDEAEIALAGRLLRAGCARGVLTQSEGRARPYHRVTGLSWAAVDVRVTRNGEGDWAPCPRGIAMLADLSTTRFWNWAYALGAWGIIVRAYPASADALRREAQELGGDALEATRREFLLRSATYLADFVRDGIDGRELADRWEHFVLFCAAGPWHAPPPLAPETRQQFAAALGMVFHDGP